MPGGGTELQIPIPVVSLDVPLPNLGAVANATKTVATEVAQTTKDVAAGREMVNDERWMTDDR